MVLVLDAIGIGMGSLSPVKKNSVRSGFSPRSGRQHKAWGVSPRVHNKNDQRAREAGDSPHA
jgi:hypothetical protein